MANLQGHLSRLGLQCNVGKMGLVAKGLGNIPFFKSKKVGFESLREQMEWWCSSTIFFFFLGKF